MTPNVTYVMPKSGQPFIRYKPRLLPAVEVKDIGGRWEGAFGTWRLPPICLSIEDLYELYPADELELDATCTRMWMSELGFIPRPEEEVFRGMPTPIVRAMFRDDPEEYAYQRLAVRYLVSSPHPGSLLALSPGLGKTVTTIAAALALKAKNVLVISPLTLMMNWQQEADKWAGDAFKWAGIVVNQTYGVGPSSVGWSITNYDTVVRQIDKYQKVMWDIVILDESILVKNKDTKRSKAMRSLQKYSKRRWLVSGSPTSRYADDLFSQLQIIDPISFSSYWRFAHRFCYVENGTWGTQITGTNRRHDAKFDLRDFMFVRNQKDVLKLPPLLYETVNVEMTKRQQQIYDGILKEFLFMLDEDTEVSVSTRIAQLTRLQQCVSTPRNFGDQWPDESGKLLALEELLEVEEIPTPAIIWYHWHSSGDLVANALRKRGKKFERVEGDIDDRNTQIQAFKEGLVDFLVMSLGVGKYGHTLTNAQAMVYFDRSWDADAYIQSRARVHRIGLTHSPVIITLRCPKTVEEMVEASLESKSVSISQISNNDLASLLRGLKHDSPST